MTALHETHRPQTWENVVGQDAAVKTMRGILKRQESHAFLLNGPSGTGKTTLARIAARQLGALATDIIDIDAADNTGVDAMRAIKEAAQYRPFGKSKVKCLVIDECHRLSGNAWDSLLKAVEEPPKHVYWFFCTTNPSKVPNTIKTRSSTINLKLVEDKELGSLLDDVCETENVKVPDAVVDEIIRAAKGSPRQLLVNLSMCCEAKNKQEALQILQAATESDAVLELCRMLVGKRPSWTKAMAVYKKLETENPEGVRIIIQNYVASALKSAKTDREACFFLEILESFNEPYNSSENAAPLLRSIGRVLFAGEKEITL